MSRVVVSEGYRSVLSLYDTQEAIALIKKTFEKSLSNPRFRQGSVYPHGEKLRLRQGAQHRPSR